MLHQKLKLVKSRCCFSLCEKQKIAAAEARAGREFLSPETPFLLAPPERIEFWRAKHAVSSAQNRFGFGSINAPTPLDLSAWIE